MSMKYLKVIKQISKRVILDSGDHQPQVCLFGTKGNLVTILQGGLPDNSSTREILFSDLGYKLSKSPQVEREVGELEEVYLITEAWSTKVDKKEYEKNGNQPKIRPSEDPNKIEVLIISYQKYNEPAGFIDTRQIIREPKLKLKQLYTNLKAESMLLDAFFTGWKLGIKQKQTMN